MKKFLVAVIVLISVISLRAQTKERDAWGYPFESEVIDYAAGKVDIPSLGSTERFKVAKKADGWYTYTYDYVTRTSRDFILCWDRKHNKYTWDKTKNTGLGETGIEYTRRYFLAGETYTSKKVPLYGYIGWTTDVINLLADSAKLCDGNLEALSRAYFSDLYYRTGQMGDYVPASQQFNLGDYAGHMTRAQLDTFRYYNGKELITLKRLIKQNPAYTTLVGNVQLKYWDEVTSGFLTLAFSQNINEGLKELDGEPLYDPETLTYVKNLLNSCDKNGILFCQGDDDTYPLYYLQAKLGIRRDVLLVNTSLLGLPIYANFVRAGVFDAPGLPLTLDTAAYATGLLDYVSHTDTNYEKLGHVDSIDKIIEKEYLMKPDILMVNLLNANHWKRSLYFAPSVSTDQYEGLDSCLKLHGYVYQLTPTPSSSGKPSEMLIDTDFTFDMLMNKGTAIDWKNQAFYDDLENNMIMNERLIFMHLAKAMDGNSEAEKCVALLDKYQTIYPNEKIPYDAIFTDAPELYNNSGEKEKALEVAQILVTNASKQYKENINRKDLSLNDWDWKMRSSLYPWQQMVAFYKNVLAGNPKLAEIEKRFNDAHAQYAKEYSARALK